MDFGTGYSALSALRQLPIDGIKIDRCFVSDILENPVDATITRGLVTIAQGLDLAITAEGIETAEQRDLLIEYGVRHLQGYLFAKPVSAEEFESEVATGAEAWIEAVPLL